MFEFLIATVFHQIKSTLWLREYLLKKNYSNYTYFKLNIRQNAIKKLLFAVLNPPKCIANLRTQPMHFKMNLEIYQTLFVMKEVVLKYLII